MQLPVITFIQTQLNEADSSFDVREGTAFYDLFVDPQQLMLQPLSDFMAQRRIGQSIREMLMDPTPDTPTTFVDQDADDAAGNLYVTRDQGTISTGVVQVSYVTPVDLEYPALTAQFTAGSLNYFNIADYTLSAEQMQLQTNGSLFYANIPIQAEAAGSAYSVGPGSITNFVNDSNAVLVTNPAAMSPALDPQTNTQLLTQTENSIGVRDLETVKGINAILNELFPFLTEIVSIGMGDPEMQRDIFYNIHVGAYTDVYLMTAGLTAGSTTIQGLVTDTTRNVPINQHIMIARNETDPSFPAFVGTPSIVANTVVLKEDVTETSAEITSAAVPPSSGINLTGTQWLNLQIDEMGPFQFTVSGVTPAQTQQFEIINAINAAFGITVATQGIGSSIDLTSPTIGEGSQIIFYNTDGVDVLLSNNAADVLFGITISGAGDTPIATIEGVAAATYIQQTIPSSPGDYIVDYIDGNIYQTSYSIGPRITGRQSILSGQTMIAAATTGKFTVSGGNSYLDDPTTNQFLLDPLVHVRPGDVVTFSSINGTSSGTVDGIVIGQNYFVSQVVSNNRLKLSNFSPTSSTSANSVTYTIVSQQTVNVSYQYNPISIDIGGLVLLADGLTRGIRPGRAAYTITDTPFAIITSIQQVDPDTGAPIGNPLNPPGGYGDGGYGEGGYGVGMAGDYIFIVNSPPTRFSMFEDSMIVFTEAALSNSYTVNYLFNPQLQAIHTICRNDGERVTGADVLPKIFIPCFVSMNINVRIPSSNTTAPTTAALATLVANYVSGQDGISGIDQSDIITLLEGQGVNSIQNPFTMTGTVYNPDGSTTIITSTDILTVPSPTLPSQTSNYTSGRISHCFPLPGGVTVTNISTS
jgi:hypothetical protein